ncbi:alkaline phosphatase-like protein [Tuber magnatum]|uniref:Alkaline phosphatase-like protein n=1 Tax=Tuber magnatum TaxID=42249 RepID=A0A317SY36_9PEZI|nr:alkaline phosphatase-like protein [Tuber magnatum]
MTKSEKRPNFLVIVADDLGFSDCSCFGSEIQTPNIDRLASKGLRFTNFHVAGACSPTRSMLMTGTDHHIAGLGQLSEYTRNSPAHQGKPGHEGYLNDKVVTLPQLLKDGGYFTIMSGKWHLGLKPEYSPHARGFERSYALLPGCANHYGFEPQYNDHLPGFFETAVTALHMENSTYVPQNPPEPNFYSSDFYASKLVDYLETRTPDERSRPFFAYLPFSAPHWPLQAPEASVKKYEGLYKDGPDALRLRRLESLMALGLVSSGVHPHPVVAPESAEWNSMTPDARAKSARSMEVYAGMVDRMDENIGRVLSSLEASGEAEDTYILLMSDNGAEGASLEAHPIMGDEVISHLEKYYDNSLDNIGRYNSFVWYGTRWAQAATAPWGAEISHEFCTVMDLVPTILDLAGVEHPGTFYNGKPVAPLRGEKHERVSSREQIHSHDEVSGWEIAGSGAIRRGRYKITYVPAPKGPQRWELFDLQSDPGETEDLSRRLPEVMEEMLECWEKYKREVGVVGLAGELGDVPLTVDEFEDTGKWTRFLAKGGISVAS